MIWKIKVLHRFGPNPVFNIYCHYVSIWEWSWVYL